MMKTIKFYKIFVIFFILTISWISAFAQFGKNKTQYKEFKWKYIQTKHFDIYFYEDGYPLAEFAAAVAESSLTSLSNNIDYTIANRIPLVIFNSHNDFQQNNIIEEYLPEGVGGVTELFKNRVLVPFEGNYEQFRHVIHHELLHAFMNDMYYGGSIQNIISKNISLVFPIWFNEGMAEVQSLNGLDIGTDMYIRDAVINNYLPPIEYCDGYMAYRGGQSFFAFLIDTYGEDKIGKLMNNIKSLGNVEEGFKETFKIEIDKLSEKWHKYVNQKYWSESVGRKDVTDFSKNLTDHTKEGGFYNISPKISPNGQQFVFISNRDDFFDVFLADANTGEILDKLVSGNTTSNFEELQVLTPGLTWSPDSRKIAISVKAGEKDAIFIIDVSSGKEQKISPPINVISYVTWSPTNEYLAFAGVDKGQSDIYTYNLKTKKLQKITDDVFSDSHPVWSPDGKFIFFSSDRGDYLNKNMLPQDFKMSQYNASGKNIYKIDISTGNITKITNTKGFTNTYIQFTGDYKKALYVSDKNGISNVYMMDIDSSGNLINERPITNSLNPIDQISLSADGKKLLFVSLNKGGYDIFSMDNPLEIDLKVSTLEPTNFVKKLQASLYSIDSLKKNNNVLNDSALTNDTTNVQLEEKKNLLKKDTLKVYGSDVVLKFNRVSYDSTYKKVSDTINANNSLFNLEGNLNPDGSYKIKDYKIKFSPDIVYGNAAYSSFYGVQGVAQISLSDLMGNHRIDILTSMVIDLKNSDYAVSYYYLPKRLDLGFTLYHTARFIFYDEGLGDNLFRFRNYGGNISFAYPFNKFRRIDGSISLMNITRENLDFPNEPSEEKLLLVPSLSFVFDNTLWGYLAPSRGTRYNITALSSPKLSSDGLEFSSLLGDFRHYIKLGDDYSFAMRFAGGFSVGSNPQRFFIGGVDNWINREFENNNLPLGRSVQEYAFSMPGLPLRGFNYDRMSGSKYALLNLELRFPLFKYLIMGLLPIGFQNIQGNLFIDAGTAWSDTKQLRFFDKDSSDRLTTRDLLLGTGFGTRAVIFGFPLKFDVAWNFNMNKFSKPKYYISLGLDF